MIKFFRKIRQKLLTENKFSKYLLYAFGEIILVVIGILIAVGVNGWYNAKKNDGEIKVILTQAQQNLLVDIIDSKRIFDRFIIIDSLSRNVLNDNITIKTNPKHIDITDYVADFNTNKGGYQRLIGNLENLPEKYTVLMSHFNLIYEVLQADIDNANTALIANGYDSKFDRLYSNPQHGKYLMNQFSKEETGNYLLNDPMLKNKTIDHVRRFRNLSRMVNIFRIEGISLYKKLDSLLGNQINKYPELLCILPPYEVINPYLGDYKWIAGTARDIDISISIENGHLISHYQTAKIKLYWNEGTYFFMPINSNIVRFYKNEKGQRIGEAIDGMFNRIWIHKEDIDLK
jgi:hypothetical protein